MKEAKPRIEVTDYRGRKVIEGTVRRCAVRCRAKARLSQLTLETFPLVGKCGVYAMFGMNPHDPASFNHRTELLSTGRTYHFVDQLPSNYDSKNTPTLLCIHGFPDLWFGWRYQIGPWHRAGNRVVVPDMLGYGSTDMPLDSKEYSTKRLTDDLAALLDLLSIQKAVREDRDAKYSNWPEVHNI
jgi:hypothetical protein